jgi:hypothetical protein
MFSKIDPKRGVRKEELYNVLDFHPGLRIASAFAFRTRFSEPDPARGEK